MFKAKITIEHAILFPIILESSASRQDQTTMKNSILVLFITSVLQAGTNDAFAGYRDLRVRSCPPPSTTTTAIRASPGDGQERGPSEPDRRQVLCSAMVALIGVGSSMVTAPSPAQATYSAYARREEDWQGRVKEGKVAYSSASALRSQLREIAPMNAESSKLFCPNGPTSNVSPLMENKCGDREATPSVFGRTSDVAGNSIPGANAEYKSKKSAVTSSTGIPTEAGGFPEYSRTSGRRK